MTAADGVKLEADRLDYAERVRQGVQDPAELRGCSGPSNQTGRSWSAVMNPKGWGFMIALLPGFMSMAYSTPEQLAAFLGVMLPSEFLSMTLYATGGSGLGRFLTTERHLANLNKVAAGLMVLVAALMLLRI